MSGSLPQLQTFQLPDVSGVVTALQGLELNRMRSQQLQGAEQERNNLRAVFADPNFNPSSPDAAARILRAAPNTGAQVFNALTAGQREQRQAQTALTESEIKSIELGQRLLAPVRELPEAERPRAYAAWLANMERRIPGFSNFAPREYSDAGYYALLSKASEIVAGQRPRIMMSPFGPVEINQAGTGFRMIPETPEGVPGRGAPSPTPGAPGPRAEAPGLTPAQLQAAHMLRGFEAYEGTPYFDRTAFRAGFGSDTTTLADGTVVPVRQGMTVSREDAERDLARRIPEFTRRAERNIGAENFARLPPNAQAALISIAYNYGHIPESLLPAARSGDLTALSQAVAALPANPSRRQSEAAVIAGQGPRLVQANAMAPRAAPANAMLAPPDAMAVTGVPQLPTFGPPRTLAEADYQKRMMDAVAELEKKRIEADRARAARREDAPAVAAEAGMTAEATARGQSVVRREDQPARVQEAGETTSAQTRARLEAEETVKRRQDAERLDEAIRELRNITRPGGLLQSSTGSGVGRLRDIAGEALGMSSRGARAAAELAPIADMVLKMVPRFEGPQSDADRKAYEAAAGRLADPTIPNETRLAAARQIIRLMENRRGQFTANPIAPAPTSGAANPATAPAAPPVPSGLNMTPDNWSRLWNVMTPQERALWQN